jgi:Fic family protein
MADLVTYANRDDIPTMAQAAIVHAQFESVHPFTDGNGRIGRALISAVIRRRGLATRTVVPIASAMLADTGRYFGLVNAYRDGAVDDFVDYVATSTVVAAEAAVQSADDLAELPDQWRDLARPRGGSTAAVLIDLLLAHPILDVRDVQNLTGSSYASANDALARLTETGVLALLTRRARDRVWMAPEVLDEVERMNERIGIRLPPSL